MIDLSLWLFFLLVFVRVASFVAAAPVFSLNNIPREVKAGLSFVLALVITPLFDTGKFSIPDHLMTFVGLIMSEVLTGLAMGMACSFIFAAVRLAGQYLDIQIGFSLAQLVDPANGSQNTLVAQFLYLWEVLLFFSLDAHHLLIAALAKSFQIVAPGGLMVFGYVASGLIQVFLVMVSYAVRMALPIILILVITDISLGLISKTVPHFNVMMVGLPLKIGVGMVALVLMAPLLSTVMGSIFKVMEDRILLLFGGG